MKLLLDQNISRKLPRKLADLYPGSEHVRTLGLDESEDALVWAYAKQHGFCIVTQDADYAERIHLYGAPPKVVWLRCGNTQTCEIERMLRQSFHDLVRLDQDSSLYMVELFS